MLPVSGLPTGKRAAASPSPRSLVGRDAEVARLSGAIAGISSGKGLAFLVEGEPGIGKSALVRAALPGGQWPVLTGRGDPLGTRRPFGVVLQALRSARVELRSSLETLPRAEDEAASGARAAFSLREAVLGAFDELAVLGPHVVVLEDLHWADDESIDVLGAIGHGLASAQLAFVCTARALPARPALGAFTTTLSRLGVLTRLKLGPLSREKGVALAASLLGAGLGPKLRAQVARAGGNPLLIEAVVKALMDEQQVGLDGPGAGVVEDPGPYGIAGERKTVAEFEEAGLPRVDKVVGSYGTPAPPAVQAPTNVRLSRDGTTANLSWAQGGVAPTGYDLLVTTGDGATTETFLPGTARSEEITTDLPNESVGVRIRAIGPNDVLGPTARDVLTSA